jgi:hypothetical protein
MFDLGSIEGLYARQHELHASGGRCDRWLGRMVHDGHGSRRLPLAVRCGDCGEIGHLQIRPPISTRRSTDWIAQP